MIELLITLFLGQAAGFGKCPPGQVVQSIPRNAPPVCVVAGGGSVGPTGPSGPSGPVGAAGPSGPSGPAGAAGPSGPSGPQGVAGPSGPQGPAGVDGPSGPSGPQGIAGPSGPSGPSGPTGTVLFTNPAPCTGVNWVKDIDADGTLTCTQVLLSDLGNPAADKTFTMANRVLVWTYTAPAGGTGGAFEIEATGGFSGDLLHVHQHTGSPVAGTDLIHAEATSSNVLPLRLTAASSAAQAATITGAVTASSLSLGAPLPAGSGGLGAVQPTCSGTDKVTCNGTTCSCATDQTGAGGSPGSPTSAVQYNNAGSFGGLTSVLGDGVYISHVATTTHPSAPSAAQIKQYGFQHHGSTGPGLMQFVDGDAQMETHVPPFTASFDFRWGCVTPAGAGNTTISSAGYAAYTGNTTGTAAAVAWAATDERTRHSWVQFPTTAAVNLNAGVRANADVMWRGNATGIGGFYVWGAMNIVTANAGQRVFMGVKDATAVLTTTADPNAALDTAYFGCNAADTNLSVCSNDATTTATCTTLGANFPCKTANTAYDWALWAAPNGSSIGYYIRRLVNGSVASGTISSDLPRNSVALGWDMTINSGSSAAITTMQFGGVCYVSNP